MAGGHGGSQKAIMAAAAANAGIAVAKFVGFLVTGAASMLAEAVHSVADTSNQGLLILGGRRARREATEQHPFGFGRERYFWSFVVALVLFSGGGVFALYEGIEKLRHPHELAGIGVAVAILAFGIVLESWSLRTAVVESRREKGDLSWWGFVRHAKIPELPVVLLEDVGAMFGLVFALVGVTMAQVTGNPRWDAAGSLVIGVLLVVIAVILAVEMKSALMGEAASPAELAKIHAALVATAGVRSVLHCRTQHLGPDDVLVVAKIAIDPGVEMDDTAGIIDGAEAAIRDQVPSARLVYLEPDVLDAESAPPR